MVPNNIMKLQKQGAVKSAKKEYYKYVITLPKDRVEKLGWKEGIELVDELKDNSILLRPATTKEISKSKEEPIYSEFRNSIKNILERYPDGLTWSQIRDKLNYHQIAPNNKWVRKLEKDILLKRIKRGSTMIWRLEYDTIYTIGYEGMEIEQFVKKLKDSNVQQLIDVREIALSRKNGFSKGILKDVLRNNGIRYTHIAKLGSPKEIRHELKNSLMTKEDYNKFFEEYKKHTNDVEVQDSITEVEGLSKMKKTIMLCFEKDHSNCHRSIIADELKKRGWKISHL